MISAFLSTWRRESGTPMDVSDDLVRIVDLPLVPTNMSDPDLFEYVDFRGEMWGDVRNVKQLLARISNQLWTEDSERFRATEYGWMVQDKRSPGKRYITLPNGRVLYAGWATQYLLEAAQDFITAFRLEDDA